MRQRSGAKCGRGLRGPGPQAKPFQTDQQRNVDVLLLRTPIEIPDRRGLACSPSKHLRIHNRIATQWGLAASRTEFDRRFELILYIA